MRPTLTGAQLTVLQRFGSEHVVELGAVLFADGDATYDLVVVIDGCVEIVEHRGTLNETSIASYGPSQFLGEMGLLTGQHAYLTAVMTSAGRILRIAVARLRVIMAQEIDLSEVILRASRPPRQVAPAGRRNDARRLALRHLHAPAAGRVDAQSSGVQMARSAEFAGGGVAARHLGFPAGLSGEELAARAALQAKKFGVRFRLGSRAVSLRATNGFHEVTFEDGDVVTSTSSGSSASGP